MKPFVKQLKKKFETKSYETKSYDRLSGIYQLLETLVFGPWLHKTRLMHIDVLQDAKRVLILGEGDGRFLKEFVKLNPECQVDCIDKSRGMLARAKSRLQINDLSVKSINFIHTNALNHNYETKHYDAIVTLFFLDNFTQEQLSLLVPKLVNALNTDGKWLVADFQQPKQGFMKHLGSALIWLMYRFFRWQTDISTSNLVSPKSFLKEELVLSSSKYFLEKLLYSEVWSARS